MKDGNIAEKLLKRILHCEEFMQFDFFLNKNSNCMHLTKTIYDSFRYTYQLKNQN